MHSQGGPSKKLKFRLRSQWQEIGAMLRSGEEPSVWPDSDTSSAEVPKQEGVCYFQGTKSWLAWLQNSGQGGGCLKWGQRINQEADHGDFMSRVRYLEFIPSIIGSHWMLSIREVT